MKFGIVDGDGQLGEDKYDSLDKAVEAAKTEVTGNPDTEVEVVQFLKLVSSTLKVEVIERD